MTSPWRWPRALATTIKSHKNSIPLGHPASFDAAVRESETILSAMGLLAYRSFLATCLVAGLIAPSPCAGQESRYNYDGFDSGPYLHVYPPANVSQDPAACTPSETTTCPLFITYLVSFGGSFTGAGSVPGVQIALDQINNDPTMLPGYSLHYLLSDSRVCCRTRYNYCFN